MSETAMTADQLRRKGLEALRRELGVAGMMEFLHLVEPGKGDYTAERQEWIEQWTLDEIAADIDRARAQRHDGSPSAQR